MTTSAIALVGNPNVGKSVLFHRLTGAYVNVSNYLGTTVEVARATARFDAEIDLIDTPGVLTLPARSDDERATMRALLHEPLRTVIQVGDAKNLRRTLTLTALMAELGVPAVLALNMHDEASGRGVTVDAQALSPPLTSLMRTIIIRIVVSSLSPCCLDGLRHLASHGLRKPSMRPQPALFDI